MTKRDSDEADLLDSQHLAVSFESVQGARDAYEMELSKGGVFVATEAVISFREPVEVAFSVQGKPPVLVLRGEGVGRSESSQGNRVPGVAIAFIPPMQEVRPLFLSWIESMSGLESEALESLTPCTTFSVHLENGEKEGYELDPLSVSILELAQAGFDFERMLEVIPESEEQIRARVGLLLDLGRLRFT